MVLARRTQQILDYIIRFQAEQGAPPTVREIGDRFGIRSTNGVCYHLDLLEREGMIQRRRGQARGIHLRPEIPPGAANLHADQMLPGTANPRAGLPAHYGHLGHPEHSGDPAHSGHLGHRWHPGADPETVPEPGLPILGRIAAGGPVTAEENIEGHLDAVRLAGRKAAFALRVSGDSMSRAGILDGDLVLVAPEPQPRNGQIVVAMVGDETTVKRIEKRRGQVILHPENPDYDDIVVTARSPELRILGRVVGVYRELV